MICSTWSFAINIKVNHLKLVYMMMTKVGPAGAGHIYMHTFMLIHEYFPACWDNSFEMSHVV